MNQEAHKKCPPSQKSGPASGAHCTKIHFYLLTSINILKIKRWYDGKWIYNYYALKNFKAESLYMCIGNGCCRRTRSHFTSRGKKMFSSNTPTNMGRTSKFEFISFFLFILSKNNWNKPHDEIFRPARFCVPGNPACSLRFTLRKLYPLWKTGN